MKEIKQNHTEVLRMEEKTKTLANLIKTEKEKQGESKKKIMLERGEVQTHKLKMDVGIIEENKRDDDRAMKQMLRELDEQIRQMEQDVKIAELKYKEKDDDSKMMDLKIKELMKQVPGYKLKPMTGNAAPKRKVKNRSNYAPSPKCEKIGNAFLTQVEDVRDETVQGKLDYNNGAMGRTINSNSGYSENFSDDANSKFRREETPEPSPRSYSQPPITMPIVIKAPSGNIKKPTLFKLNSKP